MNITQVKIHKLDSDSKMRAYATITIDDAIVISGLKVIDSCNGYFIAMPNRKNSKPDDGTKDYKAYIDTVYPITKESRNDIQQAVLNAYHKECEPNYGERQFPSKEQEEAYNATNGGKGRGTSIDVSEDDLPF